MAVLSSFANIGKVPELRKRLIFTLVMLAIYRVGSFVTIPGVDRSVMQTMMHKNGSNGVSGFLNMFSGGAFANLSIFAVGIMPYISASIALQLLSMVFKPLEELRKEGEAGTRKINQYTRYATVVLALFYGFQFARTVEGMSNGDLSGSHVGDVVLHTGWAFRIVTALTIATGTVFIMWIGEQITERGVGNGISLIIFAGIVANIPQGIFGYFQTNKGNIQPLALAGVIFIMMAAVATVVFFEQAQRRIPIYYARRTVGRRVYGGQTAHLPLKVNTAGTIPPIFASSVLSLPAQLPFLAGLDIAMHKGEWLFSVLYVSLIIFFCYFYTAVTFQAVDVADNLKRQQAFIPSIRQGKQTAEYIDYVLTRITLGGSLYVAAVCVVPDMVSQALLHSRSQWGGTTIMIVVGVALETVKQIEAHLITRNYEGLSGSGGRATKVRGRRDVE